MYILVHHLCQMQTIYSHDVQWASPRLNGSEQALTFYTTILFSCLFRCCHLGIVSFQSSSLTSRLQLNIWSETSICRFFPLLFK